MAASTSFSVFASGLAADRTVAESIMRIHLFIGLQLIRELQGPDLQIPEPHRAVMELRAIGELRRSCFAAPATTRGALWRNDSRTSGKCARRPPLPSPFSVAGHIRKAPR